MASSHLRLRRVSETLQRAQGLGALARPAKGWIRTIREALGMPAVQLAERLGIARQSVDDLERNESTGKITLEKLDQLAHALGCRMVYAVVPEGDRTLEGLVRERALSVARERVERVAHSMRLEDQAVPAKQTERQVQDLATELLARSPRALWRQQRARATQDFVRMACTTAGVSFGRQLSPGELVQALLSGKAPADKEAHFIVLLEEAPVPLLEGLVEQVGAWDKPGKVASNVAKIAAQVGVAGEGNWRKIG